MTKETSLTKAASKILEVLVRRGAVAGHEVKVHDLVAASGLSDSEFDRADTYLLQAGHVKGTMGGRDGSRWLTPAGIQFHQSEPRSAEGHAEARGYERIAVFAFGVAFVVALLVLAITFPKPTAFQYTVFRIVLALAASGVVAFVPGFIEVDVNRWLRAGGAIAVFVVVYFFSPANLITEGRSGLELRPPASVGRFPFDVQVARAKERIKYLAEEYLRTNVMSLVEVTGPYGDNVLDSPNLYDWAKVIEELERQGYVKILKQAEENIEFAYTGKVPH